MWLTGGMLKTPGLGTLKFTRMRKLLHQLISQRRQIVGWQLLSPYLVSFKHVKLLYWYASSLSYNKPFVDDHDDLKRQLQLLMRNFGPFSAKKKNSRNRIDQPNKATDDVTSNTAKVNQGNTQVDKNTVNESNTLLLDTGRQQLEMVFFSWLIILLLFYLDLSTSS